MKLAASNLCWAAANDEAAWGKMKELGYTGLEIAPTRIFPQAPYDCLNGAALFAGVMYQKYGFVIPSMQSIWYGQSGSIFDAADACRCGSLVFGCPRQRAVPEGHTPEEAEGFFARLGVEAARNGVRLALEANPPIYNTNYLNTTREAFRLVKKLGLPGLAVNLDVGTMIANGEHPEDFALDMKYVSHIHISEPGLGAIQPRPIHRQLALLLGAVGYRGFVSVEMKAQDPDTLTACLEYVKEVFGEV